MRITASEPAIPNLSQPAALAALRAHWPEYLSESAGLGLFMVAACVFGSLLEHPSSLVHQAIESPLWRRAFMGLAMGATAIALIMSPMGQRSGAHLNPAVTLTYLLLGKVPPWDAIWYVIAQLLGAMIGVASAAVIVGDPLRHASVRYVVTIPGVSGAVPAFAAEVAISCLLMLTVLVISNTRGWSRRTPYFAGALVALFITIEAPLSGMSMNPARTVGSAVAADVWNAIWLYFTAPPLGMLMAAQLYRIGAGAERVFCAKLHHDNLQRCIFRCSYAALRSGHRPNTKGQTA